VVSPLPNGFDWPVTRPRTHALAPEGPPDHPGRPIDQGWARAQRHPPFVAVRQSNEVAREVGDKLAAELKAGQEYIAGPKPSRKVLDLLLVNPLVWAALGFSGAFLGEAAKLAFRRFSS
jgi:hypothetical protein